MVGDQFNLSGAVVLKLPMRTQAQNSLLKPRCYAYCPNEVSFKEQYVSWAILLSLRSASITFGDINDYATSSSIQQQTSLASANPIDAGIEQD